jgi:Flp pilus assembly protein TadB
VSHFEQFNVQRCTDNGKKEGQNASLQGSDARGRKESYSMFLILFFVLLVAWLLGFLAFHIAGALIHLLLIVAAIFLVVHLVRGRSAA